MRTLRGLPWTLLLIAAVMASRPVSAEPAAPPVLGSEGEVYRLVRLVSAEGEPYLALDVERPTGSIERVLVPATEGRGVESSPFLIYEEASRTVFLTWEERLNHLHSLIRLAGFHAGEWSETIQVSASAFAFKGEPRLAATQDSFIVAGSDGGTTSIARTVLHVVWVEEGETGQLVAYAPITLLDGQYIGQRQIFDLSAIVPTTEPLPTTIWGSSPPTVVPADDDHSVNVAFVHPASDRISSVRITMLPGELARVADELRNHLIDIGVQHDWQSPEGLVRLANDLRNHLIDIGFRLDPQILRHIADGLRNHIIDIGARYTPSDVVRMAKELRNHIIDIGFRLDDRGLRRVVAETGARIVIDVAATEEGGESTFSDHATQVAQITTVNSWSRPSEAVGDSAILVSRSGQAALVSWTDGNAVFYRETFGHEWSAVVRLPLGERLNAEQATRLLENRIRNR